MIIKHALQNDVQARKEGRCCGLAESLPVQRVTVACADDAVVNNEEARRRADEVVKCAEEPADTYVHFHKIPIDLAVVLEEKMKPCPVWGGKSIVNYI